MCPVESAVKPSRRNTKARLSGGSWHCCRDARPPRQYRSNYEIASIIAPGREGRQAGRPIVACATVGANRESHVRNVEEILSAIEIMALAVGIAVTMIVGALGVRLITRKRLSQKQKARNGSVTINVSVSDGGQHATTRSKDAPAKEPD